jgi:hypothetical protein
MSNALSSCLDEPRSWLPSQLCMDAIDELRDEAKDR